MQCGRRNIHARAQVEDKIYFKRNDSAARWDTPIIHRHMVRAWILPPTHSGPPSWGWVNLVRPSGDYLWPCPSTGGRGAVLMRGRTPHSKKAKKYVNKRNKTGQPRYIWSLLLQHKKNLQICVAHIITYCVYRGWRTEESWTQSGGRINILFECMCICVLRCRCQSQWLWTSLCVRILMRMCAHVCMNYLCWLGEHFLEDNDCLVWQLDKCWQIPGIKTYYSKW